MLNPCLFLVELSSAGVLASLGALALGVIGIVASLVLLAVQLIGKKKIKALKKVLLVSAILLVLGIVLTLVSGAAEVDINHTDSESSGANLSAATIKANDVIAFSTTDKDGNPVDSSVFKDSKVTLINRWEPWCEGCKDEMPDLQELYEKYGADGFNILGVYSEEENLQEALDLTGVSYPIIHAADGIEGFGNTYPASVFVDSEGKVIEISRKDASFMGTGLDLKNKCILVGVRDAETWEKLIVAFLEK